MTLNLSNQTNSKWHKQKPGRQYAKLPRAVVSIANEFNAWTLVESHSHPWSQLAYSSKGIMHIETNKGTFVIPPEQALWLPPHTEHKHYCRNPVSYRSFHIDPDWSKLLGNQVKPLTIDTLLKSIILEVSSWPKDYKETDQTHRLLRVMLDRLAAAPTSQLFMPNNYDKRLVQIVETLNLDPTNKWTIEQWAFQVGASSRTLNRLFNKSYGMGFSMWKQKLKILKSLEMLASDIPLTDIAYNLGYGSTSAFINGFKKQLNCSPKKYINKNMR